jgi:hypothetical protein
VSSPLRKISQIGKVSKMKCQNITYAKICFMLNLCLMAIFQNVKNIQVREIAFNVCAETIYQLWFGIFLILKNTQLLIICRIFSKSLSVVKIEEPMKTNHFSYVIIDY